MPAPNTAPQRDLVDMIVAPSWAPRTLTSPIRVEFRVLATIGIGLLIPIVFEVSHQI
jgi:hypothetical protein